MTPERFEQLVKEFLDESANVMLRKRAEYSPSADVLQNFKEVSYFSEGFFTPSKIAFIFLMKHIQSIKEAIRTGNYDWVWQKENGGEGLKQRIADVINYMLLIAAALEEEQKYKELDFEHGPVQLSIFEGGLEPITFKKD